MSEAETEEINTPQNAESDDQRLVSLRQYEVFIQSQFIPDFESDDEDGAKRAFREWLTYNLPEEAIVACCLED